MKLPIHHHPRKQPEVVFIRFGRWSARSLNHSTGEYEAGVSVYPATLQDGVARLQGEDFDIPISGIYGRLTFIVTGTVVGIGSDGEPVLRRLTALPYAIDPESLPCGYRETCKVAA